MFTRTLSLGKIIAPLKAIEEELQAFVNQTAQDMNKNSDEIHKLQQANIALDEEAKHAYAVRQNILNVLNVA